MNSGKNKDCVKPDQSIFLNMTKLYLPGGFSWIKITFSDQPKSGHDPVGDGEPERSERTRARAEVSEHDRASSFCRAYRGPALRHDGAVLGDYPRPVTCPLHKHIQDQNGISIRL